jgi:hypothetical protein
MEVFPTDGDGSKPWYLVNPKIAGKWMFIPLKMVLIGIDPSPHGITVYFLWEIHGNQHGSWQDAARTGGANGLGELAEALRNRTGRWEMLKWT